MDKFMRNVLIAMVVLFVLFIVSLWYTGHQIDKAGGLRCVVMSAWEGKPPAGCPVP